MSVHININHLNIKNKKLIYALRNIYGLNTSRSQRICKTLGYDFNTRTHSFREEDLNKINPIVNIQHKFILADELKKSTYDNIQLMKVIKSYKGVRHSYNLPVNGQRTHTNAKTRKWK